MTMFFILLLSILVPVVLLFVIVVYCLYEIFKPKNKELKPGDVIILRNKLKNPFNDLTYQYETVKEIKKNIYDDIYFTSYISDVNGNEAPNQECSFIHNMGRLFEPDQWKIVNNIYR